LKAPPVDVKDVLYGASNGGNPAGGILGATIGESPVDAAARVEEAKKTANDLTGLVRHKKKAKTEESTPEPNGSNGKRKAEDDLEADDEVKKIKVADLSAKVEDAPEA